MAIIQSKNPIRVATSIGLLIIALLLPLFIQSAYLVRMLTICLIYIIAVSSLRTIAISGQISLGHAGFMSIGAYTAGVLGKEFGLIPWITVPLGGLITMCVAIITGFLFVRLRAIYFSMISLFFGIGIIYFNSVLQKWTGGYSGLIGIPPLFSSGSIEAQYYFFFGLAVLSLLVLWRIEICQIGVTLKAIAQSYVVASSVGVNEAGYRILALAVGGFFVGLAGAGYAHFNHVLSHSSFNLLMSINFVIYMIIGGVESFAGPIIGTIFLVLVPELFRDLKEFTPYISVIVMLIVIFLMPKGLAGLPEQIRGAIAVRREGKGGIRAS